MKATFHTKIVFVAYGSFGDIYPLLAVARTMHEDGYRVLFVANAYFAETIKHAGVEFAEAGTREEQLAARETSESNGDTFEGAMVRYDYLIGRNYSRVGRIIEELVRCGEQVLVVTHGRLSPAFPICEQYDIPIVLSYYAPAQIPDNREDYVLYHSSFGMNEWLARRVRYPLHRIKRRVWKTPYGNYNRWREQSGYPRTPSILSLMVGNLLRGNGLSISVRHPNIVREVALFPKWYGDPIGEDIRHVEFAGFAFYGDQDERSHQSIDAFIEKYGSPVVFTPGTAVEDVAVFCGAIADTCRLLDAPAILLSRYAAAAIARFDFQSTGAHVLALEQADLGYVLPKARLLIHHGGIGTVAQAVRAGIPQIIRPRMYDQPNNAVRVALNGLGGMLYEEGYTAEEIVAVYRHISMSDLHREHLAFYREQTLAQDGARNAAKAIAVAVAQHVLTTMPLAAAGEPALERST